MIKSVFTFKCGHETLFFSASSPTKKEFTDAPWGPTEICYMSPKELEDTKKRMAETECFECSVPLEEQHKVLEILDSPPTPPRSRLPRRCSKQALARMKPVGRVS